MTYDFLVRVHPTWVHCCWWCGVAKPKAGACSSYDNQKEEPERSNRVGDKAFPSKALPQLPKISERSHILIVLLIKSTHACLRLFLIFEGLNELLFLWKMISSYIWWLYSQKQVLCLLRKQRKLIALTSVIKLTQFVSRMTRYLFFKWLKDSF